MTIFANLSAASEEKPGDSLETVHGAKSGVTDSNVKQSLAIPKDNVDSEEENSVSRADAKRDLYDENEGILSTPSDCDTNLEQNKAAAISVDDQSQARDEAESEHNSVSGELDPREVPLNPENQRNSPIYEPSLSKRRATLSTHSEPVPLPKSEWQSKNHLLDQSGNVDGNESLLPSPTASFSGLGDGGQWNNVDTESSPARPQEIVTNESHHRSFSASNTFWRRSPPPHSYKAAGSVGRGEEASIDFFNHSFDSYETGAYFHSFGDSCNVPSARARNLDGPGYDISLPTLHHTRSQVLNGDISPIKAFEYAIPESATMNRGHHKTYSLTQPLPFYASEDRAQTRSPPSRPPVGTFQDISRSNAGEHLCMHRPVTNGEPSDECLFSDSTVSNSSFVLRSARNAFKDCTFLLPCLRAPEACQINMSPMGNIKLYSSRNVPSSREIVIASRRVESAICAFGGSICPLRIKTNSIFRPKGDDYRNGESFRARSMNRYNQSLRRRYFQLESRLSWEVETNPPVFVEPNVNGEPMSLKGKNVVGDKKTPKRASRSKERASSMSPPRILAKVSDEKPKASGTPSPTLSVIALSSGTEPPKMKYRCKLCGQPKQNHVCPYRRSLQRSIGIMVYPAVNSFASSEPGVLTPALSEMNNFVSYDSDQTTEDPCRVPSSALCIPTPSQLNPSSVTPESNNMNHSPQSSLSAHSASRPFTPRHGSQSRKRSIVTMQGGNNPSPLSTHSPCNSVVSLRPEQFRAVTCKTEDPSAYRYPVLPLSATQRKRLSDTLFELSQQVPHLTDDCASVLREARDRGLWDLAVAELMTQVVVALYCKEGDWRLDGLQQYLLTIGISC